MVVVLYLAGMLAIGGFFYFRNRSTNDLFAAGGQSPWWVSGLSSFMTVFSAATFVVWGGIAYQYGVVALSINMCYGIAALMAGYLVAGRWKASGVSSGAEYVALRFGPGAAHFFTWVMMSYRLVGSAVALYGLALLLTALMPLPAGHPFQDPDTGTLSVRAAVLIFGGVVVLYTMVGGLWAVLMTDVVQFLLLTLAVAFVAPLMLMEIGGIEAFALQAPDGFFDLARGDFTWFFLAGWCLVNFFMVGAEWAFAQRYVSVRSPKDARKSAFLFGGLYLVSPFLWLSPPLFYRVLDPTANPEQAYILASERVLPVGMMGLMVAAMFSRDGQHGEFAAERVRGRADRSACQRRETPQVRQAPAPLDRQGPFRRLGDYPYRGRPVDPEHRGCGDGGARGFVADCRSVAGASPGGAAQPHDIDP